MGIINNSQGFVGISMGLFFRFFLRDYAVLYEYLEIVLLMCIAESFIWMLSGFFTPPIAQLIPKYGDVRRDKQILNRLILLSLDEF